MTSEELTEYIMRQYLHACALGILQQGRGADLTRILNICGYRGELSGTLRYQHGILNRGGEGLLLW